MIVTSCKEPTSKAFNDTCQQLSAWCLNSGCTSDICKNINLFTEFHPGENSTIQRAVDKTAKVAVIYMVLITVPNVNASTNLTLKIFQ